MRAARKLRVEQFQARTTRQGWVLPDASMALTDFAVRSQHRVKPPRPSGTPPRREIKTAPCGARPDFHRVLHRREKSNRMLISNNSNNTNMILGKCNMLHPRYRRACCTCLNNGVYQGCISSSNTTGLRFRAIWCSTLS